MRHSFSPRRVASLALNSKCASRSLTRVRAQACISASVSFVIAVSFGERHAANPDAFGMPLVGLRGVGGALPKGDSLNAAHAFSFASPRLVAQPVTTWSFPMGASMEDSLQREFPLLTRMDGPAIVPPHHLRMAKTYREAVRLCWQLRRVKGMTYRQLAAECELTHQHVGDYFNPDDKPKRRSLPGDAVAAVEAVLGNSAISQWHARNAKFTVLEEIQAGRAA